MRKRYLLIVVSLLASLFIYVFYRTEKTVINEMLIRLISLDNYVALRTIVAGLLPLNELVIYSLPGGLWVFCITLTSNPYHIRLSNWQIDCVFIPLVFSIGLEIFQALRVTNGRFDIMDICVAIAFWLPAKYFFNDNPDKVNILDPLDGRGLMCLASYGIVYFSHVLD
ncbi:MAG TPA: hypothetical protein VEB86_10855 [Chryseosolibacter sp.]|nr:hypothetical protein [Chryseosolibacter sp.]